MNYDELAAGGMDTFCLQNKKFDSTVQNEAAEEQVLPDYIPDVKRIAYFDAVPKISGRYHDTSDGKYEFEGNVTFNVMLICDDDSLHSVTYRTPYENSFSYAGDEDDIPIYDTECEGVSARLLNPRKLSLRCRVKTHMVILGPECISPVIEGEQMPNDEISLRHMTDTAQSMQTTVLEEKGIHSSEDIELEGSYPEIQEIICCRVTPYISEVKPVESNVMLRGVAAVSLFYRSEAGDYISFSREIPLSEMIEADGLAADTFCFARPSVSEIKAATNKNNYGETRILELDFTWDVSVICMTNREAPLVRDAYSTEYATSCAVTQKKLAYVASLVGGSFSVNEGYDKAALDISGASAVISCCAKCVCTSVSGDADRQKFIISGEAKVSLLCENSGDEGERFSAIQVDVPLKYEFDGSGTPPAEHSISMSVLSLNADVDDSRLTLDMEVGVSGRITGEKSEAVVTGISFDRAKRIRRDDNRIVLYYPQKGETLWDIAKRYSSTVDAIVSANSLSGAETVPQGVMIIPQKNVTPVFSKIL